MNKKILVVANNNKWTSWQDKFAYVNNFYKDICSFNFTLLNSTFVNIPLKLQSLLDGSSGQDKIGNGYIIDPDWYRRAIISLANGYDTVIFVVNKSELSTTLIPAGVDTGPTNAVEQITMFIDDNSEDWLAQQSGRNMGNSFGYILCHEISHWFYKMFNLRDDTHVHFYTTTPEAVLGDFKKAIGIPAPISITGSIKNIYDKLKEVLKNYFAAENIQTIKSKAVYDVSKALIGVSLVPPENDPEVGCAISLSVLLREKCSIDIKETTSTYELLQAFVASPYFIEVSEAQALPGDVAIAATGTSLLLNTPIPHGHCGIRGKDWFMSNTSSTGLWEANYRISDWKKRYETIGGYKTRYFRVI